jgi:hypothetical protein
MHPVCRSLVVAPLIVGILALFVLSAPDQITPDVLPAKQVLVVTWGAAFLFLV